MQKVSLQNRIEDGNSDDPEIWEAPEIPVPGLWAYLPRADGCTEAVRGRMFRSSRPKRVRNAQKTHVLIEKPLLEEIDKSGMSRADFIRCGIKLYLEKTNPKNITSIGLRYKLGLKKTSEGMEMISACRRDMGLIGLSPEEIEEYEEKWRIENDN